MSMHGRLGTAQRGVARFGGTLDWGGENAYVGPRS